MGCKNQRGMLANDISGILSESSAKFVEHALFRSLFFLFFFFKVSFYLPEGINCAKNLNPSTEEDQIFSLLGFLM